MSRIVFLLSLVVIVICPAALPAQTAQNQDAPGEVKQRLDTAGGTQQNLDEWATEQAALEVRYRSAQLNIFYLKDRVELAESRADILDGQIEELERRRDESGRLQEVISDTLRAVFTRLENVVSRDQPFLQGERQHRLDELRTLLARTDVIEAEKLRRLLEALLVEAKYGETVEVTQESIPLDGEMVFVDLLRIGRMSLFWQTPDKTQTGTFDPVSGSYVSLPDDMHRRVGQAMEMASNMRPVELISLPLGRIER